MAIAEGKTLSFVGPEQVDTRVLETFGYEGPDQEIVTETDEFSAVCPYSGLPDFAKLIVKYMPRNRCVELKSLKYYVVSYRNVGIFQEHATAKIAEDLFQVLEGGISHHLHGAASQNRLNHSFQRADLIASAR
jgi:7-cyano-7-deazaguanine reductase